MLIVMSTARVCKTSSTGVPGCCSPHLEIYLPLGSRSPPGEDHREESSVHRGINVPLNLQPPLLPSSVTKSVDHASVWSATWRGTDDRHSNKPTKYNLEQRHR